MPSGSVVGAKGLLFGTFGGHVDHPNLGWAEEAALVAHGCKSTPAAAVLCKEAPQTKQKLTKERD